MRKNLASVIILGATAALSLSSVSPALAASYPATVTDVTLNTGTFSVGTSVDKPKTYNADATVLNFQFNLKIDAPVVIKIPKLTPGKTVPTSVTNPDGSIVKLPKLVVDAKGNLVTNAFAFKKPGTYVIKFTLPNGKIKTETVKVKK